MIKIALSIWMVLFCLTADGQAPSMLSFEQGAVRMTGLNLSGHSIASISETEWKVILPVYTHEAWIKKIDQPITGTWSITGDNIVFKPHFVFSPGETYHAFFDGGAFQTNISDQHPVGKERLELTFTIPRAEFPATSVEAVYPTSAVVPENLLRMYICFSSPMMPGEAYDHIQLYREDGSPVEKPFLIIDQELWDAERKRFTLLFDPGRIKRSLKSNLDLGAPLKEGTTYVLAIDSAWRDVNGNPLAHTLKKKFTVGGAQRTKLLKEQVKVIAPESNSQNKVVVSFNRPIDRVLMSKFASIANTRTGDVAGSGRMVDDFTWVFSPDQPWTSGQYEILISPSVEDVCGNNFNNAFDLDLKKEKRVTSDEVIKLSFSVKSWEQ